MTSEQNDLLQHVGFILLDNFCTTTTCTLLYGVFVFLFSMSTASLLRRGLEYRSTQAVLLLTIISFATATILWVGTIAVLAIQIHSLLITNLDVTLLERYQITAHNTYALRIVTTWASGILPIISNIVIIWRAWIAFCQSRRWVMIGPLVLLLGTIAVTLASQILYFQANLRPTVGEGVHNLLNLLSCISIGLSLGTNTLVTLAIVFELWSHRGIPRTTLAPNRLRLLAQNIPFILFESGVLYFVFQLITLILILCPPQAVPPASAADIAGTIFYAAYYLVSAMYPTIVVVLVNQQRSSIGTCSFTIDELNSDPTHEHNPSARLATVCNRSFAVPPTKATELESRDTGIDSKNFAVVAAPL